MEEVDKYQRDVPDEIKLKLIHRKIIHLLNE